MRVALVSDVHANAVALETVIAALDRDAPDAVVCLGGMVQGGPDPGRCADLLRELGWPVVLGNADAFVIEESTAVDSAEPVTERQLAQRARTLEQLDADQHAFVASFEPTVEVALGRKTLLASSGAALVPPKILPSTAEDASGGGPGGRGRRWSRSPAVRPPARRYDLGQPS